MPLRGEQRGQGPPAWERVGIPQDPARRRAGRRPRRQAESRSFTAPPPPPQWLTQQTWLHPPQVAGSSRALPPAPGAQLPPSPSVTVSRPLRLARVTLGTRELLVRGSGQCGTGRLIEMPAAAGAAPSGRRVSRPPSCPSATSQLRVPSATAAGLASANGPQLPFSPLWGHRHIAAARGSHRPGGALPGSRRTNKAQAVPPTARPPAHPPARRGPGLHTPGSRPRLRMSICWGSFQKTQTSDPEMLTQGSRGPGGCAPHTALPIAGMRPHTGGCVWDLLSRTV